MGEKGAFLDDGSGRRHVPGLVVKAVDATAAGDTFNGGLAVALAEGRPMAEALAFANAAAAISVTRLGAQASIPGRARWREGSGGDPMEFDGDEGGLMKAKVSRIATAVAFLGLAAAVAGAAEAPRRMSRAVLEDKVRGGWAGQMIGVAFGAPTEFQSNGKIIEGRAQVDARHDREHDPPGRPLRGDDVRRGHGPGGPRRHHRAVRRDVPRLEVPPVARERGGAAQPEPRHQGPDVGPPRLQHPRERHRLPDRVRLHRPHVPRGCPRPRTTTPTAWAG